MVRSANIGGNKEGNRAGKGRGGSIEVAIMEIMVDNQGNQVTITIKTTQLEVLQELLLNINVPSVMDLMVT